MKKIIVFLIICLLIGVSVVLISCSNKTVTENCDENKEFIFNFGRCSIDLVKAEKTMKKFASVLPYVFENESYATIICNEMNANISIVDDDGEENGEAFALWSIISYNEVEGISIREFIIENLGNLSPDDETPEEFIQALDEICYLQLYTQRFEEYDPTIPTNVTYTPIFENDELVDDMDIQDITVYDNNGNNTLMDISDLDYEPEYPIVVIGINEWLIFEDLSKCNGQKSKDYSLNTNRSSGGKIYLKKICVRKPKSLESWLGGKAELVVRRLGSSSHSWKRFKRKKRCSVSRCKITHKYITNNCHEGENGHANSCHIQVFEYDIYGEPSFERIIDDGLLYDVDFCEAGYELDVYDQGPYYYCGSYIRCDYEFEYVPPPE